MNVYPINIKDLEKLSTTSIFSSKEWIEQFPEISTILLGIFDKNEKLIGSFCIYKQKRFKFFSQIKSLPFTPHNGLNFEDKTSNLARKHSAIKKITKAIVEYLDKEKFGFITLAFPPYLNDFHHFVWNNYKVTPSYTYQISLGQPIDEINKNVDPKTRNLIKKSAKDGVSVHQNHDNKIVQKIVMDTMIKNNVSIDEKLIENILYKFSNKQNSFSFITKKDDVILSATFCVFDKEKCYYIFGGYNSDKAHSGAGPLAVWSSIEYAQNLGLKIFDFEGSMMPPIESYFRSFGGNLVPYFVVNKASFISECFLKTMKRSQF